MDSEVYLIFCSFLPGETKDMGGSYFPLVQGTSLSGFDPVTSFISQMTALASIVNLILSTEELEARRDKQLVWSDTE